ncbi:MAG: ribonuclease HII [Nanoarchaeota archaeon]
MGENINSKTSSRNLVIGIDDSGRGPLIGSMFLAGVLLKSEDEKMLKSEGVNDSKQVAHPLRVKLAGLIKDTCIDYKVVSSTPEQIDHSILSGINLNTLEAIKCADIINTLMLGRKEKIKVIVDCPSVNIKAWTATLLGYIKEQDKIELHCEHKADANHPSVSAASILAKVAREDSIEELKKKFGEFGSGYPSDPYTKEYLKTHGKKQENSGLFRKTWATWKELYPDAKQSTLNL